jgi:RNase H-like domain found in reverse transcriptase/Reverse transcriptase (RNA-dependent DNA polymerase)/Integrase zinc binding domain/Integrase core domain/Chromo (CHRromatin Organisation MOdifier) domain/Retroviral aspartyl protease
MKSRNYKFITSVGLSTRAMFPITTVLDTGAGPSLIREDVLPKDWEAMRLRGVPVPRIVNASGRAVTSKGVVVLHVQVGDLRTRVRFYVTSGLAVPCILGCNFIDRHVRAILPGERKFELKEGGCVAITENPIKGNKPTIGQTPSSKVRVATSRLLPPRSETPVRVQSASAGLRFLQNRSTTLESTGVTMANGVAEMRPHVPFWVRVLNLSDRPRFLKKDMVLGYALPHPTMIVNLIDEGVPSSEADPVPEKEDATAMGDESWKDDVALDHLGVTERKRVLELLEGYQRMWDGHLGTFTATSHRIQLVPDAHPVHCQPYRAGPRARAAEHEEVQKMLKAGVVEPAVSEWASPVVLVPKPDGSLRFCVDYRRLNAITIRDTYPLPRMDECIDSLGEAVVFSTLDCNSGYWQIPLNEVDRDKTTFCSHAGTYRFLRMPFGLRNAPATFQRAIDIVLSGLKWKTCLVYLDDVIVYSTSKEAHYGHLREVLSTLAQSGLSLKLAKCHFFKDTVDYLGHVIRPGKLAVAEKNTKNLRVAKLPTTQTELKSFLGLCNVYRRFVPRFAAVASPLTALLRKDVPFHLPLLSDEQVAAFNRLRDALLSPPILALPRANGSYYLDTDASDGQLGCCLRQTQPDGSTHPLGYWSRGLTSAERNYSTTEKECLAIVWAITHLRPYLEGQRFTVITDHQSLRWVLNLSDAQGRLARWRLRLAEFDFTVEYRPGATNHAADVMSRLKPSEDPPEESVDTEIPVFTLAMNMAQEPTRVTDITELVALQQQDARVLALRGRLTEDPTWDIDHNGALGRVHADNSFELQLPHKWAEEPPICVVTSPIHLTRDGSGLRRGEEAAPDFSDFCNATSEEPLLALETEGVLTPIGVEELIHEQASDELCRTLREKLPSKGLFDTDDRGLLIRIAPIDGVHQIVVPAALVPRLLHLEHYPRAVGHPGVTRMARTIRRSYFWPRMAEDILETVRQCPVCSKGRITLTRHTNFLELFPAKAPLESVAMDILGPLPKTRHGNRFLLVIADRYSKLTRTVPLRTTTALVVAQAFCDHWVFVYGPPVSLLTDNGPQFTAKFFQAVCAELGIKKLFTTAYHPQTNGQVERYNRTLIGTLRGYVSKRQDDWDDFTSAITYAYNSRVHTSIGMPPFELVLSNPPMSMSLQRFPSDGELEPLSVKRDFLTRLRQLREKATWKLGQAQVRYKRGFDSNVRERNKDLKEGDVVYLRNDAPSTDTTSKLDSLVSGPYEVISNDVRTFVIKVGEGVVRVSSDRVTRAPRAQSTTHASASGNDPTNDPTGLEPSTGDDEGEFVVDRLVGDRKRFDGKREYRVRWYGYPEGDDTWEGEEMIPSHFIERYRRSRSTSH